MDIIWVSVHSVFYTSLKSGIDKSTEWSTIPACPSLMCFFFFFNRGDTEGTNSSKSLFDVCVSFVLCKFVSGLILWFMDICGLMTCVQSK